MNRAEVLNRAKQIVEGREEDHGAVEDNFAMIGRLWTNYTGTLITAEDVCNMMILLKVARNKSGHGMDDNYVDICGYAACGGQLKV